MINLIVNVTSEYIHVHNLIAPSLEFTVHVHSLRDPCIHDEMLLNDIKLTSNQHIFIIHIPTSSNALGI